MNPISLIQLLVWHQKLVFVIKLLFYGIMHNRFGVDQNGFSFLCLSKESFVHGYVHAWHRIGRVFNLQNKIKLLWACVPNSLTYVVKYVQIILLFVLPNSLEGANYAKNLLRAVILVQYFPKLFRFLPLLIGQSPTGFIFESAWANFIINLLIFMLASHVVGSCWYLFGLQVRDITLNLFFF